jgi:hypothetical protein
VHSEGETRHQLGRFPSHFGLAMILPGAACDAFERAQAGRHDRRAAWMPGGLALYSIAFTQAIEHARREG